MLIGFNYPNQIWISSLIDSDLIVFSNSARFGLDLNPIEALFEPEESWLEEPKSPRTLSPEFMKRRGGSAWKCAPFCFHVREEELAPHLIWDSLSSKFFSYLNMIPNKIKSYLIGHVRNYFCAIKIKRRWDICLLWEEISFLQCNMISTPFHSLFWFSMP